jgi:hypothetical protein
VNRRDFLTEATAEEAQLALSYLVWPKQAPDPRLVDEWVRCQISARSGDSAGTARREHFWHRRNT